MTSGKNMKHTCKISLLIPFDRWLEGVPPKHKRPFLAAYTAALLSEGVRAFRHGCVIIRKTPIGAGFNAYKTHPHLLKYTKYPFIHAEAHALFRAGLQNVSGATAYVIRLNKSGNVGHSKPCRMCQALFAEHGLSRIYYSTNTGVVKL